MTITYCMLAFAYLGTYLRRGGYLRDCVDRELTSAQGSGQEQVLRTYLELASMHSDTIERIER